VGNISIFELDDDCHGQISAALQLPSDAQGPTRIVATFQPILFAPKSTDVDPRYAHILAEVAKTARSQPSIMIEVVGSADEVGSVQERLELAQQRARKVAAQLEAIGLSASRINVGGVLDPFPRSSLAQSPRDPGDPTRVVYILAMERSSTP
jgi:outer membrane protein OmpA-like peptidoglycan-associated protein